MKFSGEYLPNGLIRIHVDGKTYDVTEASFMYDGPLPVVGMQLALGEVDAVEHEPPQRHQYMNGKDH